MCMLQKPNILICTFLTGILFLLTMPCTWTASAEAGDMAEELPDQMLFHIENMKPGDWATETYTVSNKHREKAHYVLAGRFSGGSEDRKSTRLNSSHVAISYAVFCLQKKSYK